ncbi:hypothetical protein [uncultured Clostridium sp.]|uniref:hypothetical protein n=1 Tax=uncultured Clostridium sp. TaxID=59620 RepID=UPI0025D2BE5A|nr:hypothetical protein [uncultured Clostridium sp.]
MGKKYLMFIDGNGFFDLENNFYMTGIIFDEWYCDVYNDSGSSLKKIINDNKLDISVAGDDKNIKRGCILKTEVYNVLKESEFSVIISRVKSEDSTENKYAQVFNKLLKKYYYYVMDNSGEAAGIVMEAGKEFEGYRKQQEIFNLYRDREKYADTSLNIGTSLINKFVSADDKNKRYNCAVKIADIIRNSISYSYEKRKNNGREYRYSDRMNEKIMEIIHEKVFTEEIAFDISKKSLIEKYQSLKVLEEKIINLEEALLNKEKNLEYKNNEIAELMEEIKVLQHQLDDIILKSGNNILFEILSDVDVRIRNTAK